MRFHLESIEEQGIHNILFQCNIDTLIIVYVLSTKYE